MQYPTCKFQDDLYLLTVSESKKNLLMYAFFIFCIVLCSQFAYQNTLWRFPLSTTNVFARICVWWLVQGVGGGEASTTTACSNWLTMSDLLIVLFVCSSGRFILCWHYPSLTVSIAASLSVSLSHHIKIMYDFVLNISKFL